MYAFYVRVILVLICFVFPCVLMAQDQRFGSAPFFYNHPKFDRESADRRLTGVQPLSFLYNTPSDSIKPILNRLKRGDIYFLQIHLINEPCLRNRRCGKYELLSGLSVKRFKRLIATRNASFRAKVRRYSSRAARRILPNLPVFTTCAVNPLLETVLHRKEAEIFFSWVTPFFNHRCHIVWNPIGNNPGAPINGAYYSEGHGEYIKFDYQYPCIANNDGTPVPKERMRQFLHRYRRCDAVFLWSFGDNCNTDDDEAFTDPRERACKWREDWSDIKRALSVVRR